MGPQDGDETDDAEGGAGAENVVTSQPEAATAPGEKTNPVFAMPPPPAYAVDIPNDEKTEKTSLTSETKGDYGGTENQTQSSPSKTTTAAANATPTKTETTTVTINATTTTATTTTTTNASESTTIDMQS